MVSKSSQNSTKHEKIKSKVYAVHTMMAHRGSSGIAPLILNFDTRLECLTFRHCASSIWDRRFATLQRTLFIYLINKYISLSDICFNVDH